MANVAPLEIHVDGDAFATSFATLLTLKVNKNPKYGAADAKYRAVAELMNFYDDYVIATQPLVSMLYRGSGSPESVVETSYPALYLDEDSSAFYIKTTASGDTGWTTIPTTVAPVFTGGVTITGGITSPAGQGLNLLAGAGATQTVRGGDASTSNTAGGTQTCRAGDGNGSGAGGNKTDRAGNGGATGNGGAYTCSAGNGGATSGHGGTWEGRGGTATDGHGGGAFLTARPGVGTDRNGGNAIVTAGAATGAGVEGSIRLVGRVCMTMIISPSTLAAGETNDYAPTGHGQAAIMRIDPDSGGTSALSGIVPGTIGSNVDGRMLVIMNVSTTAALTLEHQDTSSSANNRIICPNNANLVIPPGGTRILFYDDITRRWRVSGAVA